MGKCADELTDRRRSPFALYSTETNHEIDQHALARKQLGLERLEAFEEVLNRRAPFLRDLIDLPCRNAVDATLIFINLLKCHTEQVSELALGEAKHLSVFADPRTDLSITG